jgi:transcriptional regulator with XRE-family HTH domain
MATRIKKSGLNRRVKRRMSQLGLSQVAVAEAMGWSQGQVGHLCTGRVNKVFADRIFKLADVLQCDARWLALGDGVVEGA